jgi:hypothetical protein
MSHNPMGLHGLLLDSFFIYLLPYLFAYPWINNNNSVALVRERTTSTERSPLVGEISGNFYG